jgi:hypothetical protein
LSRTELLELIKLYNQILVLKEEGIYPGQVLYISIFEKNNKFLAKILFTAQHGEIQTLNDTSVSKGFIKEDIDGIYYSVAFYNYDKKKVVCNSDFVTPIEFLPLETYNIEWTTLPYHFEKDDGTD